MNTVRLFRVLVNGEGFTLPTDEGLRAIGFYKTEFVIALSPEHAGARALAKTLAGLRARGAEASVRNPAVCADEIEVEW
ncbi:MAG TPA: hypothetical protein VFL14_10280, partial [Xanthomonadales bacterium]|nr:hypothetical protein [Xanthomonadales bacterium]